ncbi:MAG: metal-dependent hydrolase [Candidatus Dojkabacteria bacterium]|nr:MAG: metal-dependent hydrolase [Candidatus Dojkabacteria bacterium]GIV45073.1 MAG: metal-dependent hydrolase [Bacteroidia bacterium]
MNIKSQNLIKVGSIEVLVWRKDVKNLHLNVLPPDGGVRVTAPIHLNDDAVKTFIAIRLPWVKKHQQAFRNQSRQTLREYVSGESHYFFGNRYILEVVEKNEKPCVYIKNKKKIVLVCRPGSSKEKKREIILSWYRQNLSCVLQKYILKWERILNVHAKSWRIRRMKTKWGSCNPIKRTVNFNLELAKYSEACIEYAIVHELLHLIERNHNDKFKKLMDQHYPKWRQLRYELNQVILADFQDY